MKIKNYINNTILSIFFCFLATQLTAQKKQDKFDIISLNLIQSDLKVESGNLIISNKSDMTFDLNYSVNNGKGAKESYTIYLKFRGRRLGDPTKAMEYKKRADAEASIRPETPMVLTNVVVEIYNERGLILTDSVNITINNNYKTNFAVLLNGIGSKDFCEEQKLNHVFMNEFKSSKYYAVVIGLNNTKKEPSDIEKAVSNGRGKIKGTYVWTESHDKRTTRIVEPITDKNGNWFFKDSFVNEKDAVKLLSFSIEYITACNDSFKYVSVLKQQLSDKKPWDYKVKMSAVASDNPIFQGTNEGGTNILALTIPASSINISGGNLEIKDNSQLNMLLSNSTDGGFNTTNISSATISMKLEEKGDGRVFYHWGSVVSTSNPKINTNFDTGKYGVLIISSIEIRIVNLEKDTIIYLYNLSNDKGKYGLSLNGNNYIVVLKKTEKNKYIDPCKTKYKLKEIFTQEGTESNIYGLYLSFNFENNSDLPAQISMNVEITDCNKKTQNIELKLNYDSKTGLYYATQAITTSSNCKLEITAGTVTVINECGVKTKWNFDASEAKAVGPGGKCSSNKQCRLQVCKLG